jgi:dihydroorotase
MKTTLVTILLALAAMPSAAQDLDLLIKNGHVIDPKNGIDRVMDVGIAEGRIAVVAPDVDAARADAVVDAAGLYVTPGLIDMHVHVFHGTEEDAYISNSYTSVPADAFTFRTGVTTAVDVGSAGWRNIRTFVDQAVNHSETRVLAFLNIVGAGMKGGAAEQDLRDMDPKLTAMTALKYPEVVVGVKLAHYEGPDWTPTELAVEAGRQADLPVMIDFGRAEPPLSLETLFFDHLRPGDIFTHVYGNVSRRESIVENGRLRPFVLDAQQRGVVFDVGHGGSSFAYAVAAPATRAGLWPSTISTDLHAESMNAGMKDLSNVMSKFLALGMPLTEVIRATTWTPAEVIRRPALGHLDVGSDADVAVLRLRDGAFGLTDSRGYRLPASQKMEAELTIRAGRVVWDLNGLAQQSFED